MSLREIAKAQFFELHRLSPTVSAWGFAPMAGRKGLKLAIDRDYVDVRQGAKVIRLSHRHQFYLPDLIRDFDYYFSAVEPICLGGVELVDYSTPRYHDVIGFPLHPVIFPSLAEPLSTTSQYLDFGELSVGDVVLDLGAYSGLTSILFDQIVGPSGKVIAVDADLENIKYIRKNVRLYGGVTGRTIEVEHGAVWENDGELEFSSEGSMGSSAASIVGRERGALSKVSCFTLTSLAERHNLDRVDFIKCDVEGAEAVIFEQPRFFARFRPRIIMEVHPVDGRLTTEACRQTLSGFGYECRQIDQPGSNLPLLECVPA